jgi:hypothetical protein
MPTLRRTFLWLFRDRDTGRLTAVQWPNIPLAAYLLATVIHLVLRSGTTVSTVVAAVASAALVIWAVLEIAWGVNPFRRGLGSVVLILVVVSAFRHTGSPVSGRLPPPVPVIRVQLTDDPPVRPVG